MSEIGITVLVHNYYLAGHSVGFTDLVTPVTSPDWHDRELGQNNGTTDSGGYLLGALHTETDVAI